MHRNRKERKRTNPGAEDEGAETAVAAEGVVEEGVGGFKNEYRTSEVSVSSMALVFYLLLIRCTHAVNISRLRTFCQQSISQRMSRGTETQIGVAEFTSAESAELDDPRASWIRSHR